PTAHGARLARLPGNEQSLSFCLLHIPVRCSVRLSTLTIMPSDRPGESWTGQRLKPSIHSCFRYLPWSVPEAGLRRRLGGESNSGSIRNIQSTFVLNFKMLSRRNGLAVQRALSGIPHRKMTLV